MRISVAFIHKATILMFNLSFLLLCRDTSGDGLSAAIDPGGERERERLLSEINLCQKRM